MPKSSPLATNSSTQVNGTETVRASSTAMTATRTLANLASSLGVPFGRRRQTARTDSNEVSVGVESPTDGAEPSDDRIDSEASANELFKRRGF